MSRTASQNMQTAESTIRLILQADTPGDQMEGLLKAYDQSSDRPAFVAVLIGNLVSARQR